MREILFRGKMLGTKKWIYGDLLQTSICEIFYKNTNDSKDTFARVIPETVGQYTGLTDRDGVKIFEGDIVDVLGCQHTIIYVDEILGYAVKCKIDFQWQKGYTRPSEQWFEDLKNNGVVVGDVYGEFAYCGKTQFEYL